MGSAEAERMPNPNASAAAAKASTRVLISTPSLEVFIPRTRRAGQIRWVAFRGALPPSRPLTRVLVDRSRVAFRLVGRDVAPAVRGRDHPQRNAHVFAPCEGPPEKVSPAQCANGSHAIPRRR